jgi:signal transduction histidine kinase
MVLALTLAAGIGVIDYSTGRDAVISAFYLVPICWITWIVGRSAGVAVSLVSVLFWLLGDLSLEYSYTHPVLPYWNAAMLLVLFLPTVYLLSAFQRAHLHLEETVRLRTAALHREIEERQRAEKARIQAERLAVVGGMAAQVAHEVRNPLGAIVLTLDLVKGELEKNEDRAPGEGTELIGDIREEVQRIDRVIMDYLALAHPRKARLESLDLSALLCHKLTLMRGVFAQADVFLKDEISRRPAPVNGDPDQLWQAILNIIRNGLEAMPGGGTLTVSLEVEKDAAIVRVRDTGGGMTGEQQEKLFVPFVTSKAHGTGLGLVLVQQVVAEHAGRIECLSTVGEGTQFTLHFPLRNGPDGLTLLEVPGSENS